MPPDPNVGGWIGPIGAVRAGVNGAAFSAPTLALDTAAFTISYDTTGPGGARQIKVIMSPTWSPTLLDMTARSLVLGTGFDGMTNLSVIGTAQFAGPIVASGDYLEFYTKSAPSAPSAGHVRAYYDGSTIRLKFPSGAPVSLLPWPAVLVDCPAIGGSPTGAYLCSASDTVAAKVAKVSYVSPLTFAASAVDYIQFSLVLLKWSDGSTSPIATADTQAGTTSLAEFVFYLPGSALTIPAGYALAVTITPHGTSPATSPGAFRIVPG